MKWCNKQILLITAGLLLGLVNTSFSSPINPSPHLLSHGQYELSGTLVTHQVQQDGNLERQWPFVTGLEFGVLDRSTFGIQYGDGVSIHGKTLIFEDEGWVPSMTLGFRHLFHSQEAHLFQINEAEMKNWENDIYLQFSRVLESGSNLQGGINILSSLGDGGASPFWGFHYRMATNLGIDYEGFQRDGLSHHNLGLSFVDSTDLSIGLGFFEVQEWLYQEGQMGFFASPERERADALFSPGVYFEVRVRGLMSKVNRSTTQLKIKDLEMKQKMLGDSVSHLRKRLARTELLLSEITGPRVVFDEEAETEAALILDKLVQTYRTTPDDVSLLRSLQDSLLAMEEPAHQVLISLADHPATDNLYRETVIKVMGNARLKQFSGSLVSHLSHPQIIIRREALISLGKVADLSTLEEVKKLTTDKDPIVKIIAEQVVKKIIEKAKEIESQSSLQEGTSSNQSSSTNDSAKPVGEKQAIPSQAGSTSMEKPGTTQKAALNTDQNADQNATQSPASAYASTKPSTSNQQAPQAPEILEAP